MQTETISKDSHPNLYTLLQRLGYKKKSATVVITEDVELSQPYWDAGSKDEYIFVKNERTVYTDEEKIPRTSWPNPPGSKVFNLANYDMIIVGGISLGKPAFWRVYMSPEMYEKFTA